MHSLRRLVNPSSKNKKKSSSTNNETIATPPLEPPPSSTPRHPDEDFADEDRATARERLEYDIPTTNASRVMQELYEYYWKRNCDIGPVSWVEIVQDSETGRFETGMTRVLCGYRETIVSTVADRVVVYTLTEGMPTAYNKGRITLKETEDGGVKVLWTLLWSPSSVMTSLIYKAMIVAFMRMSLYRISQKVLSSPSMVPERLLLSLSPVDQDDEISPASVPTPKKTGYQGNLTPQQTQALHQLKTRLETLPYYHEEILAHPDGERWLLRFMRATMRDKNRTRVFEADEAFKRVKKTYEFRHKYEIEAMMRRLVAAREGEEERAAAPSDYGRFKEVRPHLLVESLEGEPILIEKMGLLSSHVDVNAFAEEEWIRCFAFESEMVLHSMRKESRRRKREVSTAHAIIDERGVGAGIMSRMKLFGVMNEVASICYPEMLEKIFVVNAPRIFTTMFSLVKPFIDENTISKLVVHRGVPLKELAAVMDIETQLPVEYGGGNTEGVVKVPLHAR